MVIYCCYTGEIYCSKVCCSWKIVISPFWDMNIIFSLSLSVCLRPQRSAVQTAKYILTPQQRCQNHDGSGRCDHKGLKQTPINMPHPVSAFGRRSMVWGSSQSFTLFFFLSTQNVFSKKKTQNIPPYFEMIDILCVWLAW